LRWTCQLLRRAHPWLHRDGAGPGIVEGGPCRGVAAPGIVAGAIILVFPLPFPLTLAAVVGGGGRRGRGHRRIRQFLLWWAWRRLLLQRTSSS
jgi:hypothetical protein